MNKKTFKIGMLTLALVLLMGAFSAVAAAEIQPRYNQAGTADGKILYVGQKFTVNVTGVSGVTQIRGTAILYEEGFWCDTQVATLAIGSNCSTYSGEQSCTIQQGKSYRLEINASAYLNGAWEPITRVIKASF